MRSLKSGEFSVSWWVMEALAFREGSAWENHLAPLFQSVFSSQTLARSKDQEVPATLQTNMPIIASTPDSSQYPGTKMGHAKSWGHN